jgi:tellurite resistance protein
VSNVAQPPSDRLAWLPVSIFAIVMGLAGLAIAWEKAGRQFGFGVLPGALIAAVAAAVFAVLLVAYGLKILRHRDQVLAELRHPVKLAFVPTISIAFLLLSIATLNAGTGDPFRTAALVLWTIGTVGHLVLTLHILGSWMHQDRYRIEHMNPAWFIPAVGNVIVPVAGVPLGFVEVSWFFFAAGIMSWIVLLAVVVNRILFHEPFEQRLLPTMFILMAPPAIGFISWVRLTDDGLDPAGRILYFFAAFLGLLLLTQVRHFARIPFGLPAWAYSFPLAALTIATLLMSELSGLDAYAWAGIVLLLVTTAVGLLLVTLTVREGRAGRICVPGR